MGEMGRDYNGSYAEYTVLPKSIIYPFTLWRATGPMER